MVSTSSFQWFLELKILWGIILFLAPFFVDCIGEQDLNEMNIEIIRNTLYKAYLEAFYDFCKKLGGTTSDVMCEILAVSIFRSWKHGCRFLQIYGIHASI